MPAASDKVIIEFKKRINIVHFKQCDLVMGHKFKVVP